MLRTIGVLSIEFDIYLVALDWDLDLGWSTSGRGGKWGRMKGFGLQPGPRGRSDQELCHFDKRKYKYK